MADVRDAPAGGVPAHLRDAHYPGQGSSGTARATTTLTTSPGDGWTRSTGRWRSPSVYYRAERPRGRRRRRRARSALPNERRGRWRADWLAATGPWLSGRARRLLFALGSVVVALRRCGTVAAPSQEQSRPGRHAHRRTRRGRGSTGSVAVLAAAEDRRRSRRPASRSVSQSHRLGPGRKVLALGPAPRRPSAQRARRASPSARSREARRSIPKRVFWLTVATASASGSWPQSVR